MNTDSTADIAFSGFMAGWSMASSVRKSLEIFDDLPADERPGDRDDFRRAAALAVGMLYNERTTMDDIRTALDTRFGG